MKILGCENLSASYGTQKVLENLSFYVESGKCLCILGENGTGKSTLVKCLLGLLKQDSGIITKEGFSSLDTGYLPQQMENFKSFPATVFEVVLSGCLNMRANKPFYSKREKQIAEENLKKLGVFDLKKQAFCELSGGQKQKVLLARALCTAKKLLILDEPAAGLDPVATGEMYEVIDTLKKDGMGILMVSHDTSRALSASDLVLHIDKENGYFFGTKEEYLKSSYAKTFDKGDENVRADN